jgi:UDP-glucose 4-epimerase
MNVWVTGGAGFLGSHLVEALAARGDAVTVVDDFSTGALANLAACASRVSICRMNLLSAALRMELASARPRVIFHLAGDALVSRSVADPLGDCERNMLSTLKLLEAVRAESPESKVLFASTGAVYGDNAAKPFTEADTLAPISPYAVAKLAAERYCFAYARTFGLHTCSLRLFSVYGPRQKKQVVYDLIRKLHAAAGEIEVYGDGTQERDFSHAANIVDAFLLAAEHAPFHGEAINVAGNEIITIHELISRLCALMNKSPGIRYTGERRPGDSQRWIADTSVLGAMGFTPRVQLTAGLRDTIDWYIRQL